MEKKKMPFRIDLEKFYYQKYGALKPKFKYKLKMWMFDFGFHAVAVYRFGQFAARLKKRNKFLSVPFRFLYHIMSYHLLYFHFIYISGRAKIGPGFYIARGNSIIIPGINIGENFTIHHNVTIGTRYIGDIKSRPTIGNNVWIGIGSIITGKIRIGHDVTISSGCVISKDVPDDCLVAGNPGRIILRDHDNSRWMRYKMPPVADRMTFR